jgi:hypothetical protein
MGEPRPPPTLTNPDLMKNFPAIFLALLVGTSDLRLHGQGRQ